MTVHCHVYKGLPCLTRQLPTQDIELRRAGYMIPTFRITALMTSRSFPRLLCCRCRFHLLFVTDTSSEATE